MTVVIVAIAAMFALPTAALAADGAFTNNSATVPAVKATNSNAKGIGVEGTGKKDGVYSNGPLGVAAGKSLSCTKCVGPAALSSTVRTYDPIDVEYCDPSFNGCGGIVYPASHHVVSVTLEEPVVNDIYYVVQMDRDVSKCIGLGQAADYPTISVTPAGGTQVDVEVQDSNHNLEQDPWKFVLTC